MRTAFLRLTLLGVAALASLTAWAQDMTVEQKEQVLGGIKEIIDRRAFVPGVDFKKWDTFLEGRKEDLDKAGDVNAFAGVINRALREFGFSHIRLLTPRAASSRNQTSTIGIGATVSSGTDGLVVRRIYDESPAALAGLKVGDIITVVNGVKPQASGDLEGEEGQKKTLMVKKGDGQEVTVEIEIKKFSTVRKETLTWVNDDTAVLRIFTFSAGYGRENIEGLLKEANGKAKHLILDLRSNGGGAVSNLNHLLSLLLPNDTEYGIFVSRRVHEQYVEANPSSGADDMAALAKWSKDKTKTRTRQGTTPFKGRIAVLINRGSASASEICAAALKDNADAILVGDRSAGAVLASTFARLPEGFSLQFPVSDYVTAKGMRLEANPLQPDARVTERVTEESDPVVTKALEMLEEAAHNAPPSVIKPSAA